MQTCMHTLSKECANTCVFKPAHGYTNIQAKKCEQGAKSHRTWWDPSKSEKHKKELNAQVCWSIFTAEQRAEGEKQRERERASCIMHGSVEQQWLLHCTLSLGFQVSVLSVKQAAYRRARCSHMTLYLSCLRAQGHQPIQLLGLSLRTQDLTSSLIRTCLWSGRAFRSWRGKPSTDSCILYNPGWNAIPFWERKKRAIVAYILQRLTVFILVATHELSSSQKQSF